jgi:hypothetical protein
MMNLKSAGSFAVLASSTVTNTGHTTVTGNLGLHPGSSVTGFPPGVVDGNMHVDPSAGTAQSDLTDAYIAAGQVGNGAKLPGDIGGQTLSPGIYHSSSSLKITGEVTLNGGGLYIFQIGSTLTTASDSKVNLTGGAQAADVYWQVGSSATLGTHSTFVGTIMAMESVTVTTGTRVSGRLLARNGAVTLDSNTITIP